MENEELNVLEQIEEAVRQAKAYRKTLYVFQDDGRWWYSGFMPKVATRFFIVYPNGTIDRSVEAGVVPKARPRWGIPALPPGFGMRAFLTYAAFAPYLQCYLFLGTPLPSLVILVVLCLPLSLFFLAHGARRHEWSSAIVTNSHVVFCFFLMYQSRRENMGEEIDPLWVCAIVTGCLMMSGVGLLGSMSAEET